MTPALTPALALGYLRELSADVRAAAVLDADGRRLAGPEALARPAAAAVAALDPGEAAQALLPDGAVLARRGTAHAIVLACGPQVLAELAHTDLRLVLGDLEGPGASTAPGAALEGPGAPGGGAGAAPGGRPAPRELPTELASAVLSALQSGSARP